jgi:hypothetical protein
MITQEEEKIIGYIERNGANTLDRVKGSLYKLKLFNKSKVNITKALRDLETRGILIKVPTDYTAIYKLADNYKDLISTDE